MTFGIDFGTSNSVVARWIGHGTEVIRINSDGLPAEWNRPGFDELFPSVVSLRDAQRTLCFGWSAKCETSSPQDAVKRMLAGRSFTDARPGTSAREPAEQEVWLGDEPFRSTVVAAALFEQMRAGARRNLRELQEAVVTVPANATGAARYRTRAAARLAGIKVRALINEPTAAAISYAHEYPGEGRFLVFDWGGGTIDVTLLEHYDGIFDEIASRGIAALGGLEFDEALARLVLRKLGKRPEQLTRSEAQGWRRRVELSKIALSQPGTTEVFFEPPGYSTPVLIERHEFEHAVEPLVRQALVPLEECLSDVGVAPEELDAVLMIGGTSQIPLVRREVENVLQTTVVDARLCNPMTAVARGAAITAAEIDGLVPDTTISVATSHDLGLAFDGGRQRGFVPLIPRYSTLPALGSKSAMPNSRGATRVTVEIVEGDSARPADADRNFPLARLELPVPQPNADPSSNLFDIEYRYDRDGILKVRAVSRRSGQEILNKEIDCFGNDGTPIDRDLNRDLERLLRRVSEPATPAEAERPWQVPARDARHAAAPAAGTPTPVPLIVIDGRAIMSAGRTSASPRPPSYHLLGSALAVIRERFPDRRLVTVMSSAMVDDVEHSERDAVDAAVAAGDIIAVPSGTTQNVLKVAEQLGAPVVSMENLMRFRAPYPWLSEGGRYIQLARVQRQWLFPRE